MPGSRRQVPWPSSQPTWPRPPWSLRGRVLTAWCQLPADVIANAMSRDLLADDGPTMATRVRFYDLEYKTVSAHPVDPVLAPPSGRFRECSVAVPARHGDDAGELSLLLWSDSEIYQMWGREIFGWPIRLATVELSGELWTADDPAGAHGDAAMRDAYGTITMRHASVGAASETPHPPLASTGVWLIPRLVAHRGGLDEDSHELLLLRPEARAAGRLYSAQAELQIDFAAGHPLAALSGNPVPATFEVTDQFDIVVGSDVEVR
jgi:hypothetical protein